MANILVIEDDINTSDIVKIILRPLAVKVAVHNGAEHPLDLVYETQPDVILLDLCLPEPSLDGLAIARQLKDDPQTQHIPIIIFTATSYSQDEMEARQIGCEGFLRKPVSPDELRDYVTQFLETA
jgi:CheY-like chemotaxis protein